jgi:hypothetical protein
VLCDSVFAKTGDLVRFLMQSLDPERYQECCDAWKRLPRNIPIKTYNEGFLSPFVLGVNGYTQRHKDIHDVAGGLAGLCTFGNYTGRLSFELGIGARKANRKQVAHYVCPN